MPNTDIKRFSKHLQNYWKVLVKTGIWLLALISTFLLPPPTWDFVGGEDKTWYRFAQFLAAALVGLIYVPMLVFTGKQYIWRWWTASVMMLVMATAIFLVYQYHRTTRTSVYAEKRIVIGDDSSLLSDAREYKAKNPQLTVELLILESGGAIETIWAKNSIAYNRIVFGSEYLLAGTLLAICILTIVQTIECSLKPTTRSNASKLLTKGNALAKTKAESKSSNVEADNNSSSEDI